MTAHPYGFPEAFEAACAFHRAPLQYPVNVSRLLEAGQSYKIYDVSSQTYNAQFAAGDTAARILPRRAWTLYNPQLDTYLIVWNGGRPASAIRHSVAHELGHIVLNHQRGWPTDPVLAKRQCERAADAFALYLLAPFQEVRTLCGTGHYNARLVACYFGIPYRIANSLQRYFAQ